jgi:multidrug efflux system outer membrane protein
VNAERKVLDLAETRYRGGVAGYLEVLDAQRSLFDAEVSETGAVRDQFVALIQLYKALGGGWPQEPESEPEKEAAPTEQAQSSQAAQ